MKINAIFSFLFLTGVFLPKDIEDIMTGLTICINPFSYLQLKFNGNYNFVSVYFDFGLENANLKKLGIQSDSTIVNITSLILSIVIFWFLHLFVHLCAILFIFYHCCISDSEVITKGKQVKLLKFHFDRNPLDSVKVDDTFFICFIHQSHLEYKSVHPHIVIFWDLWV